MDELILAKLNDEQITAAKRVNGEKKQITHVLICGGYGQIFGTHKHCLKYFNAWKKIFKDLFSGSKIQDSINEIKNYNSTFDLVNELFAAQKANLMSKDDLTNNNESNDLIGSLFKRLFKS